MSTVQNPMFITQHEFKKLYIDIRSEAWCYVWYRKLKAEYDYEGPHQFPTFRELCEFFNIKEEEQNIARMKLGWPPVTSVAQPAKAVAY